MKKLGIFLSIIMATFILVSCNAYYKVKDIVQQSSAREAIEDYEFQVDDLFKIIKSGDDYICENIEPSIYFKLFAKTDDGILFGYTYGRKENGEYTSFHSGYYCYLDEKTKTLNKLYDTSTIHYPNEEVYKDRVIFEHFDEADNTVVMEFSASGVKELIKLDDYYPMSLEIMGDNLFVYYDNNQETRFKIINMIDYSIKDIDLKEIYANVDGEITSFTVDDDIFYYCLRKEIPNESKFQYELVEYSLKDNKIVNSYPMEDVAYDLAVKGDAIAFLRPAEFSDKPESELYVAKKSGNELKMIEKSGPKGVLSDIYISGDYIYVLMIDAMYEINTKSFKVDVLDSWTDYFFVINIDGEILYAHYDTVDGNLIFESQTFSDLKYD